MNKLLLGASLMSAFAPPAAVQLTLRLPPRPTA